MKWIERRMIMKIAVCDDCMKDALYLKGFLGGHEVRVYSDACNLFADMEDKKEIRSVGRTTFGFTFIIVGIAIILQFIYRARCI